MRKKIIEWLFGAEWEEYWNLHDKYIRELQDNIEILESKGQLIKMCEKQLEEKTDRTKKVIELLDENIKLLQLCKENEIDVTEIYETN